PSRRRQGKPPSRRGDLALGGAAGPADGRRAAARVGDPHLAPHPDRGRRAPCRGRPGGARPDAARGGSAARRPRPPRPPRTGGAPAANGEGNAEEWLDAVPSSLAPAAPAPVAVQRLRLRYRKVGSARFIGSRELGTVFARAARRARLPVAFSHGHHPLPRLSFGPGLPVGASSEAELLDIDLSAVVSAAEARARLATELPDGLELL